MTNTKKVFGMSAAILTAGALFAASAMASEPAKTKDAPKTNEKHADKDKGGKDKGGKGAETKSEAAAKIGAPAPAFSLKDINGKTVNLADFKGKVVVLEWFNPECPFVKKHHEKFTTMVDTYNAFKDKGVVWVAINSGAPGKEGAGLEKNKKASTDWKLPYSVLLDESGATGKAYGAKTTPHMYIINAEGNLVYAGAIDNDRSADKAGSVNYVKQALTQVLAKETVTEAETKPYGCSVKYGN